MDSMVLASLYHALGLPFAVAHVNHGLRGEESDSEEAFVRDWCAERQVEFFSDRLNLQPELEAGANLQKLAREHRYLLLERWRKDAGMELIATAHHLDDQIETVVFHAMRRSSVKALAGIPEQRENIIRPLLRYDRKAIEDFANSSGVYWKEDSSNKSLKYQRNKIRHELLPELLEKYPKLRDTIIEESSAIKGLLAEVEPALREYWLKKIKGTGELRSLPKAVISEFSFPEMLAADILRSFDQDPSKAEELIALLCSHTGSKLVIGEYVFWNDRTELIIENASLKRKIEEIRVKNIEELRKCGLFQSVKALPKEEVEFSATHDLAHIALQKLEWPLTIGPIREGDRFMPLGMKGSMLLSDFLTQRKYSMPAKERCLVLRSGKEIAWVLNDSISELFKLSDSDNEALELQLKMR